MALKQSIKSVDSGFLEVRDSAVDAVLAPFPETVEIEFQIEMRLEPWQRVTVIGSTDELGHWRDGRRAIMQRNGDLWSLKR